MARRTHDYKLRRSISIRLQLIIEERFTTLNGFLQAMAAQNKSALASTVRGWLPPQRLWKSKRNGSAIRRVDWLAVKVPDCSTLIEFCDTLSIRTDHVLLGDGVASRRQSREKPKLEQDISAHLAEALKADGFGYWSASDVNGASVLKDAAAAAKQEAVYYSRMIQTAPAQLVGRNGLLLDLIGKVGTYLPETPEALSHFLMLSDTGALLEAFFDSDPDFDEQLKTRYLTFPDVTPGALPVAAMDARMSAALERAEANSQKQFELTASDEARLRAVITKLRRMRRKPTQR